MSWSRGILLVLTVFMSSLAMAGGPAINLADEIQNNATTTQVVDWIKQGANINAKSEHGESALRVAIEKDRFDIVRLLLDNGASVNVDNNINTAATLFWSAAMVGNRDIVKLLLAKGEDINVRTGGGLSAIELGIDSERPDVIKLLMESGANPNAKRSYDGQTTLMHAMHPLSKSLRVNPSVVSALADYHADVNAIDRMGVSVLEYAVLAGDPDVVRLLIERGASPNSSAHYGPIILLAASIGSIDIVKYLLDKGADVNAKSTSYNAGDTALMASAYGGHYEVMKLLVNKGADVHSKDQRGHNILKQAAFGANSEIVKTFLGMGLNVNEKGVDNYNVLMAAARGGNPDVVKLFISKGLDVNAKGEGGTTALIEAAQVNDFIDADAEDQADKESKPTEPGAKKDHIETVRILLAAGADRNAKDWNSQTALDHAKSLVLESHGHDEIVKLLQTAAPTEIKHVTPTAKIVDSTIHIAGLNFQRNDHIQIVSEELEISTTAIRVKYLYRNTLNKDVNLILVSPAPILTADPMIRLGRGPENTMQLDSLRTSVNGKQIGVQISRSFVFKGQDITKQLRNLGLSDHQIFNQRFDCLTGLTEFPEAQDNIRPACGFTKEQNAAIKKLSSDRKSNWEDVKIQEIGYWEQKFNAGEVIEVSHEYKPFNDFDPVDISSYAGKELIDSEVCLDSATRKAVLRNYSSESANPEHHDLYVAGFKYTGGTEQYLNTPISDFKLILSKANSADLISLCFPGKAKKTSETKIEFVQKNYALRDNLFVYFYSYQYRQATSSEADAIRKRMGEKTY